jgi:hypothetical protein
VTARPFLHSRTAGIHPAQALSETGVQGPGGGVTDAAVHSGQHRVRTELGRQNGAVRGRCEEPDAELTLGRRARRGRSIASIG